MIKYVDSFNTSYSSLEDCVVGELKGRNIILFDISADQTFSLEEAYYVYTPNGLDDISNFFDSNDFSYLVDTHLLNFDKSYRSNLPTLWIWDENKKMYIGLDAECICKMSSVFSKKENIDNE